MEKLLIFYNNARLHICSIRLRLDLSSLTKNQYLQTEPSENGMYTDESMMLKISYLYGFVRWTKCIWWAVEK